MSLCTNLSKNQVTVHLEEILNDRTCKIERTFTINARLTHVCLLITDIDEMIYSSIAHCVGNLRVEWTAL